MVKCWQIVELKEKKRKSVGFSVSMVSEKWIREVDDAHQCFWPDAFARSKIIAAAAPEPGESWKWYPCRILLNGAKFTDYDKALEAEQMCMNVSTMSEFDRKDKKSKFSHGSACPNKHYQSLKLKESNEGDAEADSSSEDNYLSGNDSFDFNKRMLFRCWWNESSIEEPSQVDVENSVASKPGPLSSNVDVDDYKTFKSQMTNALTSSAIAEEREPKNTTEKQSPLTRIGNIQNILNKFTADMQRELDEWKQSALPEDEMDIFAFRKESDAEDIVLPPLRDIEVENIENDTFAFRKESDVMVLPLRDIEESDVMVLPLRDIEVENIDNRPLSNSTFTISAANVLTIEETPRTEGNVTFADNFVMPTGIINIPTGNHYTASTLTVVGNLPSGSILLAENNNPSMLNTNDTADEIVQQTRKLALPIADELQFKEVEELLFIDGFVDEFKELTLPKEKESEPKYMDRIFLELFEKDFFIDFVVFRKEKNRIDMKGTNILMLWKESFATQFETVGNEKFISHCRRLKSAIRAAAKAEAKSKNSKAPN